MLLGKKQAVVHIAEKILVFQPLNFGGITPMTYGLYSGGLPFEVLHEAIMKVSFRRGMVVGAYEYAK